MTAAGWARSAPAVAVRAGPSLAALRQSQGSAPAMAR